MMPYTRLKMSMRLRQRAESVTRRDAARERYEVYVLSARILLCCYVALERMMLAFASACFKILWRAQAAVERSRRAMRAARCVLQ